MIIEKTLNVTLRSNLAVSCKHTVCIVHHIATASHHLIDRLPPVGATQGVTINSVSHAKRVQFIRA